ncbi:MAG: alpha/beta hydrolase [Planctomycetota bacterium]|jgi:dienelactone hydrolase
MRIVLAAFLLAAVATGQAKTETKIAKVWIDYARACVGRGAKTEGQRAIGLARAADPQAKDLEKVAGTVEALTRDEPPDTARRAKAHRDAAKLHAKLGNVVEAIRLDPSKARVNKALGKVKKLAGNRKNVNEAGKLLAALRDAAPEAKGLDKAERAMALSDVAVLKAAKHPLVGYLSLPKGWKPGKEYDVLVAVDGAGSGFLGAARGFAKARGGRGVIVLAPCTLANTNKLLPKKYPFYPEALLEEHSANRFAFDLEGLLGLLAVIKERYGGNEKVVITGFSGGGNLCYGFLLTHPGRVLGAAPACANFSGMGARDAGDPQNGGPRVHIMTGAQDPHRDFTHGNKNSPGIEPQTDRAVQVLAEKGFTNVKRTMLKGVKHSALRAQVWEFYDELRK